MEKVLCLRLRKGLIFCLLVLTLSAMVLAPLYAQEDLSPAEESEAKESDNGDIAGTESNIKPSLWKNTASGQLYANSGVKFFLEASDNLSKTDYVEYKIDEGDFIRYNSAISLSKDGPHTISYRAIDRAGNREFDQSFSVIIDNLPPEVKLVPSRAFVDKSGRLYTSAGNTFTIRAVDQHSGVKNVAYGINVAASEKYEEGRTVQLSDPGSQLIRYKATDNLGNATRGGSILVEVDSSRPKVSIRPSQPLRRVNGSRYARRSTSFSVLGEDEGAGVSRIMVRIDGSQNWQVYSTAIAFETEAEHSIEAKAIDAVGNESEVVSSQFKVDDNPPITKLRTSVSESESESGSE